LEVRIALCLRADAKTNPGGDFVIVKKTAKALEQLGLSVEICCGSKPTQADLIHIFNLTRLSNSLAVAKFAVAHGIPYVLTPIWHSLSDMKMFYGKQYGLERYFPIEKYIAAKELIYERFTLTKSTFSSAFFWKSSQQYVVNNAKTVLPNSPEEGVILRKDLDIKK